MQKENLFWKFILPFVYEIIENPRFFLIFSHKILRNPPLIWSWSHEIRCFIYGMILFSFSSRKLIWCQGVKVLPRRLGVQNPWHQSSCRSEVLPLSLSLSRFFQKLNSSSHYSEPDSIILLHMNFHNLILFRFWYHIIHIDIFILYYIVNISYII